MVKSNINNSTHNLLSLEKKNKKTTQGRKKIEIKKINEKSNLQVTFSKRRNGLFKKANELCLLCGAKVAIITFSPGRKAYTFGHPDVDGLLDCYIRSRNDGVENVEAHADHAEHVSEANREYEEAVNKIEEERKLGERIEENNKKNVINGGGFWWEETNVEELGLEELEVYVKSMKELQENVVRRINELNFMENMFMINDNSNNNNNLYNVNYQNISGGILRGDGGSRFAGGGCSSGGGGDNCDAGDDGVNEFCFGGMRF